MNSSEIRELLQQGESVYPVRFDISPVYTAVPEDLDAALLSRYFSTVYQLDFEANPKDEQLRILMNSSILIETESGLVPTVGGILVFGKNPERHVPQSVLSIAVFNGTDITDPVVQKKEISANMAELVESALGLMLLYVPEPLVVEDSAQRKDTLAIPRSVLRESLVNAVCHRDYSISTRRIQVYIFKDRIEIRSPGRIANSLTLEMIRWGNSAPRNMFLVKLMDNLRYIDGLGRGIPLMIRLMGSRVSFFEEGDTFKVVLRYA